MRCFCPTCEDHKSKPKDQSRNHCAYRHWQQLQLQQTEFSCNRALAEVSSAVLFIYATRYITWVPGKFLFNDSAGLLLSSKKNKTKKNNKLHSLKILFCSDQSYQMIIITYMINVKPISESDWHQTRCKIEGQEHFSVNEPPLLG